MNIKQFGIAALLIFFLAGCDPFHRHDGSEPAHNGHDHGATEKKQIINTAADSGRHRDAFGGLDLDMEDEHPEDEIIFSAEQQKLVDFAAVPATKRPMRSSLPATGIIQASSHGQAIVTAPVSGYLAANGGPFPRFGDNVRTGDIITKIVPSLKGDTDPATLDLAVQKARSGYQLATKELVRVEALFKQGIVSEKRLQEAVKEERNAQAELASAEQRFTQYQSRPEKQNGDAALNVTSPIDGIIDGIYVTPGAYLREGDALFHVVNTDTLRLEVKIPEADIARLINPQGAWFTVDGYDKPFQIDFARGDRLIAMGNVIDPQTRTLPLIFEFRNTENLLRVGMFARAHVIIGEPRESIAVPVSAVQEHNGMSVVYVQRHEDAFERRVVALGIRDGDFVEVRNGIHANENVVAIGAYLIQLAASGPQEAGHGHAH